MENQKLILIVDNKQVYREQAREQLGSAYSGIPVAIAEGFDNGLEHLCTNIKEGKETILLTDVYMTTQDERLKERMRKVFPIDERSKKATNEIILEGVAREEYENEDPLGVVLYLVNLYHGGTSAMVSSGRTHHGEGLQCVVSFIRKHEVGGDIYVDFFNNWGGKKDWEGVAFMAVREDYGPGIKNIRVWPRKENVKKTLDEFGIDAESLSKGQ